jgi:hypothetical protein
MADLFVRAASADVAAGAANVTFAIDATGGDFLEVSICVDPALDTISTVSYAGAAMTLVDSSTNPAVSIRVETWKKVAPATGSNNVIITPTANFVSSCVGGAQLFNGVNQVTPLGAANKASSNAPGGNSSVTVTSVGANNSAFDALSSVLSTISTPSQTQSYVDNVQTFVGAGSHAAGNASRTFTWTIADGTHSWAAIAFEVNASAAAAGNLAWVKA